MIARLIRAWFPTTVWKDCLTFDLRKATAFIERGIRSRCEPFVLALDHGSKNFSDPNFDGNEIVGCVSWHLDNRLTVNPIAVLDEIFVVPRLRRSDLGRRLIALTIHLARADGAAVINFPIASGMPEQRSLINMLTRHMGAEPVGVILRKVLTMSGKSGGDDLSTRQPTAADLKGIPQNVLAQEQAALDAQNAARQTVQDAATAATAPQNVEAQTQAALTNPPRHDTTGDVVANLAVPGFMLNPSPQPPPPIRRSKLTTTQDARTTSRQRPDAMTEQA